MFQFPVKEDYVVLTHGELYDEPSSDVINYVISWYLEPDD